jgi:tetratricopeptide (TPR) repeat protein
VGLVWYLWGRIQIRRFLAGVTAIFVLLLLLAFTFNLSSADLFDWLATIDAGSKQGDAPPTSWLNRLEIWQVGSQLLSDYPIIGAGLYTFDPVSRANYGYRSFPSSFNLTHAHNLFLQTGSSLGIVGLLALAGIWGTAVYGLWQASRSTHQQIRRLSAVFAASITGYLFFNLFDTITFGQKPGLFVWLILAGASGLSLLAKEQSPEPQPSRPRTQLRKQGGLVVAAASLLLLFLTPQFSRNWANLRLDQARFQPGVPLTVTAADFPDDARRAGLVYYLEGDEEQALSAWRTDPRNVHFLQTQGTVSLVAGRPSQAIAWYDLALLLDPAAAEVYFWRGAANEERGTLALAEADFQRAVFHMSGSELSHASQAYIAYRWGLVLAETQEWQSAVAAFEQAALLDPNTPEYFARLGDVLTTIGDEDGATAAYQKARREVVE